MLLSLIVIGDGFDGGTTELLDQYKDMINFSDRDQKNNFKWVEGFLRYTKKHHPDEDNTQFLLDAIDLHQRKWSSRNQGS